MGVAWPTAANLHASVCLFICTHCYESIRIGQILKEHSRVEFGSIWEGKVREPLFHLLSWPFPKAALCCLWPVRV